MTNTVTRSSALLLLLCCWMASSHLTPGSGSNEIIGTTKEDVPRFLRTFGGGGTDADEPDEGEVCVNHKNETLPCGTASPTDCEKVLIHLETMAHTEQRRRQLPSSPLEYLIEVVVHVIKDGSNTGFPRSNVDTIIETLNDVFVTRMNTPFRFTFRERNVVDEGRWHIFKPTTIPTMKRALRKGSTETLNIYIGDTRTIGYLGQATFPHKLMISDNKKLDGILLMNPFLYSEEEIRKAEAQTPGIDLFLEVYETVVHEVGHWLGLFHTFDKATCDDSSPLSGDAIADTPVQRCPSWDYGDYRKCFVKRPFPQGPNQDAPKGPIDSCPKGNSEVDAVHNYMNYIAEHCMKEQGEFTNGQIERMVADYELYRYRPTRITRRNRSLRRDGVRWLSSILDDREIIERCTKSLVQECDCEELCAHGVYNVLYTIDKQWGTDLHATIKPKAVEACSQCNSPNTDADCPVNTFCAKGQDTTYIAVKMNGNHCVAKRGAGTDCRSYDGRQHNAVCQSGFCSSGFCKNGVGEECSHSSDCLSNSCQGGICRQQTYSSCTSNGACETNLCRYGTCKKCSRASDCPDSKNRFCSSDGRCLLYKRLGESCSSSADKCSEGTWCSGAEKVCVACEADTDCPMGNQFCSEGKCIECDSWDDLRCDLDSYCNVVNKQTSTYQKCVPKRIGGTNVYDICIYDFQCVSNRCVNRKCLTECDFSKNDANGNNEDCSTGQKCIEKWMSKAPDPTMHTMQFPWESDQKLEVDPDPLKGIFTNHYVFTGSGYGHGIKFEICHSG